MDRIFTRSEINKLSDFKYACYIALVYEDKLMPVVDFQDAVQEILLSIYENKVNNKTRSYGMEYIINKLVRKYTSPEHLSLDEAEYITDNKMNEKLDNLNNNISNIIELNDKFSTLTRIEQKVLKLRYYCNLQLTEVGECLGLTFGRIKQIEARAIRKLKNRMILYKLNY